MRATIGDLNWADGEYCLGRGVAGLTASEWVEPRFLFHYLRSQYEELNAKGTGSTFKQISKSTLQELFIPLPPLPEQRCIVARIEELTERIDAARRLRAEAAEEADVILSATLDSIFAESAPEAWDSVPLGTVVDVRAGSVDPTLPEYRDLPHISGSVIESVTCKLLPYKTAAEDGMTSSKYLFSPGEVLYSKIRPYLRKATLVDFEGVCSADMYPIAVTSSKLFPRFLMWSLVSLPFTHYAIDHSARARIPKINRHDLFAYQMPLPTLDEQYRIVEYLDAVQAKAEAIRRYQEETREEIEAMTGAVLERAFRGEL